MRLKYDPTATIPCKLRSCVLALSLFVVLVFASAGCMYSNIRFPLDEDLWKTELGSKVGISSNYSIAWLVAWGDAGIKAAAKNGGITVVNHADMGIESYVFGLYTRRDTIVYGD